MIVEFILNAYANPLASAEIDKNRLFSEGDVQDLPVASAQRWIRRGIAIESIDKLAVSKKKKKRATKSD